MLEVNELPRRVVDWWGSREPTSALWHLTQRGTFAETVLDEELPRDLYPSQSWASVGTGVPWEQHGVFWYGDPKPAEYPFYWQVAARAGRTVGLVGVLHSSPMSTQCSDAEFRFVVPDPFAADPDARPASLRRFQALNLRLTRDSSRVASVRPGVADISAMARLPLEGMRSATALELATIAARVARGTWNRERLRIGQSLLLTDLFAKNCAIHRPDLAVLFTNHVASMMHRYWAATFPEDWPQGAPYDEGWRVRFADELPYAMATLDRMVGRLLSWCDRQGHELCVVSSMGQQADLTVDSATTDQAVVRDGRRFAEACGIGSDFEVRAAMAPQLTLGFGHGEDISAAADTFRAALGPAATEIMTTGETLTITYDLTFDEESVLIGRRRVDPEAVGVAVESITDHRSGRHSPRGVLISSSNWGVAPEIDAFEVAPLLLDRLGVAPLGHHRSVPALATG